MLKLERRDKGGSGEDELRLRVRRWDVCAVCCVSDSKFWRDAGPGPGLEVGTGTGPDSAGLKFSCRLGFASGACVGLVVASKAAAGTCRTVPLFASTVPRLARRMLPVFDIQLVGELKCIDIDFRARLDGVESAESDASCEVFRFSGTICAAGANPSAVAGVAVDAGATMSSGPTIIGDAVIQFAFVR